MKSTLLIFNHITCPDLSGKKSYFESALKDSRVVLKNAVREGNLSNKLDCWMIALLDDPSSPSLCSGYAVTGWMIVLLFFA